MIEGRKDKQNETSSAARPKFGETAALLQQGAPPVEPTSTEEGMSHSSALRLVILAHVLLRLWAMLHVYLANPPTASWINDSGD